MKTLTVTLVWASALLIESGAFGQTHGPRIRTLSLGLAAINSGTIALPGQQDRFTFVGTVGQRLYFDTLDYAATGLSATLYTTSGAQIFNIGANTDFGPFYLTEAGTNTLVLDGNGDATGNYSFRMLDLSSAVPLTLGVTVTNSLNPQSQTLVYGFSGTNGQRLTATNIAVSSSDAYWRLVSPAGVNLFQVGIASSPGEVVLPETGAYRLLFEGYSDAIGTLDFRSRLSLVSNPSGAPSGFGTMHSGDTVADQTNDFTYAAPAGSWVYVDSQTNSSPVMATFIDPSNAPVFAVNGGADAGPYFLPRSGTYTLRIVGYDSGSYRLRLLDLSGSGATALNAGTTYTATLNPGFKTDAYRFTGTPGQRIFYDPLDLDYDGVNSYLYDPSGNVLIGNNSDYDAGPFTLSRPGTYFLVQQSQTADDTMDYSFRLLDVGQAPTTALTLDTQVTGTLDPGTRSDLYRFSGTSGQRLFFDAMPTNLTSGNWALYGPNNQWVGSAGLNGDFEALLLQTGIYVVNVSGNVTNPAGYSIRVVTPNAVVSNLALGATVAGTLVKPGDEHRFTFTGSAGQRLFYDTLDADNDPVSAYLYDSLGNNVFFGNNADYDFGPFTLALSGVHTLMVKGSGDYVSDYSFRLVDVAQPPATVLTLDTQITSTLNPGTKSDLYRFSGTNGQRLFFDAMATNSPAGNWLLSGPNDQWVGSAGLNGDFEALLPSTGIYVVNVYGNVTNPVDYSIRVVRPNTVVASLTLGATVAGTLVNDGDEHRFTFTGSAGQRLFYDALDADNDAVYAYLYDPAGNNVFIGNNSDSDAGPFTLALSGVYTLMLKGSGDYVSDYSFRLLDVAAAPVVTYGVTVTDQLNPQLQAHLYRLNGTAGQQINLTNLAASSANATWYLYGPNNGVLLTAPVNAPLGNYILPTTGTYVVSVAGYFAGIGTLDYYFRVSLMSSGAGGTNGFGVVHCDPTSAGQTNTFSYTAPAGLPVYFDNYTNDSSVTYYLVDPSGGLVASFNGAGDSGPYSLPASGAYTLQAVGTADGRYCFRLLDLTASTTSNLAFGTVYAQPLDPGYRADVYRFTATNGQRLVYDALDPLAYPDAVSARLLTPSGAFAFVNGNVASDVGPFTLAELGIYYLFIEGQQRVPTDYRFRLIDVNQSPAQSLAFDTVSSGDLFKVFVVPSGWLSVTGSYVNVNLSGYLPQDDWRISQVANLTGTRVDTNIDFLTATWGSLADVGFTPGPNGSDANWSLFSVQWDGTITITNANTRLYLRSDNSSRMWVDVNRDEVFDYSATEFANNQWGSEIIGLSSPTVGLAAGNYHIRLQYEANSPSSANSISLLADTGAGLEPAPARVYRFDGTKGQRLFFDSLNPSAGDANWYLYGPNNEPVAGANLAYDFEATLPRTGSHLLILTAGDDNQIPFSFRVVTPNTTTNAYAINTSLAGALDEPGEEDWFSFTGAAGQRLYYDALDGDFDAINAMLFDPLGNVVFVNGSADSDVSPFTLSQSGTYLLRFKASGDYTNDYSFRILDAGAAPVLALDTPVTNSIPAPFAAQLYQLPLLANLRLFFDDLGASDSCGYHTVYGPLNQSLTGNYFGSDLEFTPGQTGTSIVVLASSCTNVPFAFQIIPGNHAPVLAALPNRVVNEQATLSFTADAADRELPNDTLTWSLDAGAPTGATLNATSGLFSWTPNEAQGSNSYTATLRVRDDGTPSFEDVKTFTILVHEFNTPPVLTLPSTTAIHELVPYSATATASDPDLPTNTLAFALVSGPTNLTVSPSGAINWTPSEAQGPNTHLVTIKVTDTNPPAINATSLSVTQSYQLTVGEVNNAPLLTLPTNQVVIELVPLSLLATATDSDVPTNSLTFALVSGPTNLTVSPSGAIDWTPSEAQGPSTNLVTIKVTDSNPAAAINQQLSVTNSFQIIVNESNSPPTLTVPPNTNIFTSAAYGAIATATDPDLPANALTFALISPPAGLTINPTTGAIAWTPTAAQGPNTYLILVSVTDTNPAAVNVKQLSVTNSYTITVSKLCGLAITTPPASRAAVLGSTVTFLVNATSSAGQTNYQWQLNSTNLIGRTNDTLSITNLQSSGFGTYRVLVNDGLCTVTSTPAILTLAVSPAFYNISRSGTTVTMYFPTEVGPTYVVERKQNLNDPSWTAVTTYAGDGVPKVFTSPTQSFPRLFFRLRLE